MRRDIAVVHRVDRRQGDQRAIEQAFEERGRDSGSVLDADIGARFGLTRERARQIEAKLTARLRDYVKAEIPDFDLLGPDS